MFIFVDKYLMENPRITCFSYLAFGVSNLEMNICVSLSLSLRQLRLRVEALIRLIRYTCQTSIDLDINVRMIKHIFKICNKK